MRQVTPLADTENLAARPTQMFCHLAKSNLSKVHWCL